MGKNRPEYWAKNEFIAFRWYQEWGMLRGTPENWYVASGGRVRTCLGQRANFVLRN